MKSKLLIVAGMGFIMTACAQKTTKETTSGDHPKIQKVMKSDEEWKKELDPETYYVTREKGTERAFTGKYDKFYKDGIYRCSNCGNVLFNSEHKFDSGSGWPSFYTVETDTSVIRHSDNSLGMARTEVVCMKCDAHLGHVFNDGPKPTGLRYCINSVSLEFEPEK